MPLRTILLLTTVGLASMAACGAPPVPPSTLQPAAPARELAVFTRLTTLNTSTPGASESLAAVDAAMVEAGYKVAKNEETAEVIAVIHVSAVAQRSLVAVTVNGQRQANYTITVEVQLRTKTDNTVLDTASATFESGDENGARQAAHTIVGRLVSTDKISLYAQQLKRQQDTQARKAQEEQQAEEWRKEEERRKADVAAKQKEDAAWHAADAKGCREPTTQGACDGVKLYLSQYSSGRYATQARQAVQEGEPKIDALKIEQDWKRIDLDTCRTPKQSTDCDQVKAHLDHFPSSPHADEARAILKKVEAKLTMMARQEEAKQKRDEAAAEAERKRQEVKDCEVDCKKNVCSAWALSAKFGLCVSRCIDNTCRN